MMCQMAWMINAARHCLRQAGEQGRKKQRYQGNPPGHTIRNLRSPTCPLFDRRGKTCSPAAIIPPNNPLAMFVRRGHLAPDQDQLHNDVFQQIRVPHPGLRCKQQGRCQWQAESFPKWYLVAPLEMPGRAVPWAAPLPRPLHNSLRA